MLLIHSPRNTLGTHCLHVDRVIEPLHSSEFLTLEHHLETLFLYSGIAGFPNYCLQV